MFLCSSNIIHILLYKQSTESGKKGGGRLNIYAERERTSGSQEKQTFNFLLYWLLFSIGDLYSASSVESRIFIFMSGSWLHVNIFQTEYFQALIIGIHIEG